MSAVSESPLQRTVRTTATEFWNDGPSVAELEYAMAHGAVGATSNPFLILEEMGRDRGTWKARAQEVRLEHPEHRRELEDCDPHDLPLDVGR